MTCHTRGSFHFRCWSACLSRWDRFPRVGLIEAPHRFEQITPLLCRCWTLHPAAAGEVDFLLPMHLRHQAHPHLSQIDPGLAQPPVRSLSRDGRHKHNLSHRRDLTTVNAGQDAITKRMSTRCHAFQYVERIVFECKPNRSEGISPRDEPNPYNYRHSQWCVVQNRHEAHHPSRVPHCARVPSTASLRARTTTKANSRGRIHRSAFDVTQFKAQQLAKMPAIAITARTSALIAVPASSPTNTTINTTARSIPSPQSACQRTMQGLTSSRHRAR